MNIDQIIMMEFVGGVLCGKTASYMTYTCIDFCQWPLLKWIIFDVQVLDLTVIEKLEGVIR